jgi:hypothetical protein
MFEIVNNGTHVQAANISDVMWVYAGQANNVRESAPLNVVRNTWEPGLIPVDGNMIFDFGLRMGESRRRDMVDMFNNLGVTGSQFQFTIPGSTSITAPSGVYAVYESLQTTQPSL